MDIKWVKIQFNRQINLNMKQPKKGIKKSNSFANIKIKFEPKQAQAGTSSIDKLPFRRKTLERCPSYKDNQALHRNQKIGSNNNREVEKLLDQLHIMKRVNESLQRQNETLKRQVSYLNQISNSRRSSFYSKKSCNDSDFKQKILHRLSSKREAVVTLENQSTAMYTHKMNSSRIEDEINEAYQQFSMKRVVPSMEGLFRISKKYFEEFKEVYIKLKVIFDHIHRKPKTEASSKMEDLLCLFQVPILYKQNPKGLFRSISKDRIREQSLSKKQSPEEFNPQLKSPAEVLTIMQLALTKVIKSPKLFQKFIESQIFYKMILKWKQKHKSQGSKR